eukprot:scaffold1254_cov158-Skeletonema_menzelii.AAC.4
MDAPLYPLRPGEQDCRDFLRTGRCKYGESCKYNHPLNVESGGGLSDGGPLPSRPGEPVCHYFLKHGICKFGQACKFDHPNGPHVEKGLGAPNNSVGGGGGGTGNGRAVASSGGLVYITDPATGATSVQVLPQRPNEPDCIYFLRNGRCKYGSICKFHHPLSGPSQNTTTRQVGSVPATRQPQIVQKGGVTYTLAPQTVTYVQQSPQRLQPIREQIQPQQQATHVLLPDGQIAIILNPQSLQDVRELSAQERPKFYISQANGTVGSLHSIEKNRNSPNIQIHSPVLTATTSASSSNNTVGTNFDLWGTTVRVPHKSNSGGSLSMESGPQGLGEFMEQSQSQASFRTSTSSPEEFLHAQQSDSLRDNTRSRATSFGSGVAEPTQGYYWPSNSSMASIQAEQGPPTQYVTGVRSAPGSGGMYRSASNDTNRSLSSSAPPTGNGHQNASSNSSDEGLSMMTASLLTMIDRPTDGDITPNTTNASYLRPPPGMMTNQMSPSQFDNPPGSSDYNYFMGGYDPTPRF